MLEARVMVLGKCAVITQNPHMIELHHLMEIFPHILRGIPIMVNVHVTTQYTCS